VTYLLCRNRVSDFSEWKAVFDAHSQGHRDAGLQLVNVWRSIQEPNNVFFAFKVANMDRAHAFIGDPSAARAGADAGVFDGEYHFVESIPGY